MDHGDFEELFLKVKPLIKEKNAILKFRLIERFT